MKKSKWRYLLFLPLLGFGIILPISLTSCEDPATFFDKYGNGQQCDGDNNNNNSNDDNNNNGPALPGSPY